MAKAAKPRHLSRAPITEALIDIRLTLPKETRTLPYLAELNTQFGGSYTDRKDIKECQYKVQFGRPELDEKTSTQLGFRYTNAENTQVIQATINGFTFSRLPPYENWERLKEEAKRTWTIYSHHVRPETITRVAVRYINRLVLPGLLVELDQYLRYVPKVPKVLPQVLGPYFSQIVVPDRQGQRTAIITQSSPPNPVAVSPILDIDVFMERLFSDEDEVWGALDQLRDFKNQIFFDCITEKTAKLFI